MRRIGPRVERTNGAFRFPTPTSPQPLPIAVVALAYTDPETTHIHPRQ